MLLSWLLGVIFQVTVHVCTHPEFWEVTAEHMQWLSGFSPRVSELQCGKMGPQIQEVRRKWVSELGKNLKWRRENIWQIERGQNVPGVKDSMRDDEEMCRRGRNLKDGETFKLLALKSQGCSLLLNLTLFFEEWGHCISKFPRTTAQNRKLQLKYRGLLH